MPTFYYCTPSVEVCIEKGLLRPEQVEDPWFSDASLTEFALRGSLKRIGSAAAPGATVVSYRAETLVFGKVGKKRVRR